MSAESTTIDYQNIIQESYSVFDSSIANDVRSPAETTTSYAPNYQKLFLFIGEGIRAFIKSKFGIIWIQIPYYSISLFYDSTYCKRQAEGFSIQI